MGWYRRSSGWMHVILDNWLFLSYPYWCNDDGWSMNDKNCWLEVSVEVMKDATNEVLSVWQWGRGYPAIALTFSMRRIYFDHDWHLNIHLWKKRKMGMKFKWIKRKKKWQNVRETECSSAEHWVYTEWLVAVRLLSTIFIPYWSEEEAILKTITKSTSTGERQNAC